MIKLRRPVIFPGQGLPVLNDNEVDDLQDSLPSENVSDSIDAEIDEIIRNVGVESMTDDARYEIEEILVGPDCTVDGYGSGHGMWCSSRW